jgi:CO/xanthine dehydrogenase Mo-binding subunit
LPFALVDNQSVRRRDTLRKITGKAIYTYDINPDHINQQSLVYMGKITCPYPRAKITKLDVSKAQAAGYLTVTAQDMPPFDLWGISGRGHTPLPVDTVLYAGQMVAAVGALTTDQVENAVDLVDVEFEPLPYVLDAEEALKPDAPQIWPNGNVPGAGFDPETGPIPATLKVQFGDVESAFAKADAVIETKLDFPLEQHYEMEPRAVVVNWTQNELTFYASNQWVHLARTLIANYFRIPTNDVVVKTALGGYEEGGVVGMALGDKVSGEELVIAAVMSKKAGLPVKYGPTRFDQALNTTNPRFPMRAQVKFGGTRDGSFTAMQVGIVTNVGAYGGSQGSDTLSDFYEAYVVPNVSIESISVNTDAYAYAGPMRDVGESQGHFFLESAVDMLAEKLSIDPAQFRLKNMRTKATAVNPVTHYPYTGFGEPEAFSNAMNAFKWNEKWKGYGIASAVNGTKRTGVGLALFNAAKGSIIPPSTGQIQVDPDGTVTVFTGLTDHGAGGNTTFPLMAAEYLGLTSLENMRVVQSDTSLTTNSSVTAGSQSTRNCGMAFMEAVKDLKKQWFPIIAKKLEVQPDTLTFGNDRIFVEGDPNKGLNFKEAASLLDSSIKGYGVFNVPPDVDWRVGGGKFVELEVDTETSYVHVINYVSGLDIGRVIWWKGAQSQVRGGFLGMGMGEALYQELYHDPTMGGYINPNYHDYRIPTMMEVPDNIEATWNEYVDPVGPFGAKGIGENVLIACSPAIANALSNALGGYRFTKLPIGPEDIVAAVQWMKEQGKL